jgi:hypothetical protein
VGGVTVHPWVFRLIVIVIAVAFLPLIVNGVTELVVIGIDGAGHGIDSLLDPLFERGDARLHGLIRLSLYVVGVTWVARYLLQKRR